MIGNRVQSSRIIASHIARAQAQDAAAVRVKAASDARAVNADLQAKQAQINNINERVEDLEGSIIIG